MPRMRWHFLTRIPINALVVLVRPVALDRPRTDRLQWLAKVIINIVATNELNEEARSSRNEIGVINPELPPEDERTVGVPPFGPVKVGMMTLPCCRKRGLSGPP